MTTDDLAGMLREHGQLGMVRQDDGSFRWECICGEKLPEDPERVEDAHYAHQAAVIAAAGWVRLEDLIEWFETEDPETLNGDDREFECVAVYLRALKDWEPIE